MNWYKRAVIDRFAIMFDDTDESIETDWYNPKWKGELPPVFRDRPDAERLRDLIKKYFETEKKSNEEFKEYDKLAYGSLEGEKCYELYKKTNEKRIELLNEIRRTILQDYAEAPYSTKNPDQSHVHMSIGGLPIIPIEKKVIYDWVGGCTSRQDYQIIVSKFYGIELSDLIYNAMDSADQTTHPTFPLGSLSTHIFRNPEEAKEQIQKIVEKWKRWKREWENWLPDTTEQSYTKAVLSLKEKAKKSMEGKSIIVYRGFTITDALYKKIKDSIKTTGKFNLVTLPLASFTTDKDLAKIFAKYGEGGKKRSKKSEHGLVFSQIATPDNVWLNYEQSTFSDVTEGESFHVGGTTQKEILLGFPTGLIELTKYNIVWIY